MPMTFPWETPRRAEPPGSRPITDDVVLPTGTGLDCVDMAGFRCKTLIFDSGVLNKAVGAGTDQAFGVQGFAEDSLVYAWRHWLGIVAGGTVELELILSYNPLLLYSRTDQPFPGFSCHKASAAPYVDSVNMIFDRPLLFRTGQILYAHGLYSNTGVAAADIQYMSMGIYVPVSMLSRVPTFAYSPNRRD